MKILTKKKNKGFTLIELLAIILILGIIALIAIPSINSVVEASKKEAFETTSNNLSSNVKSTCNTYASTGKNLSGVYTINDGKIDGLDISYDGEIPNSGTITINDDCQVALYVEDKEEKYYAVKDYDSSKAKTYKIGEESEELERYNNLPINESPTDTCFLYKRNSTGVTITGYKFENESCSKDVIIPTSIGGNNVTELKQFAFVDKEKFFVMRTSIPKGPYSLSRSGSMMVLDVDSDDLPSFEDSDSIEYNLAVYNKGSFVKKTTCYVGSTIVFETEGKYDKQDGDGYDFCLFTINKSSDEGNVSLNSIDFSRAKYLTEIPFGLAHRIGLTSIKIGNYITKIGGSAFGYNSITELEIPDNVKEIGGVAFLDNDLSSLDLNKVEKIGQGAFNSNSIDSINFGNVSYIPKMAFQDNTLTNIVIPSTVTGIGGLSFADSNTDTVTIAGSVKVIGESAFENQMGVPTITKITLGSGIEEIKMGAFATTNITSLTIPSSVKIIGDGAFFNNTLLKTLTLNSGLEEIGGWAFQNDAVLTGVKLPNTLTSLGEGAFYGCRELSSLTLSNKLTVIPKSAFYNSRISSLTIPGSIKRIEEGGFKCRYTSIKKVTFNEGLEYIGKNAFNKSFNVNTLTLPNSVKEIGVTAFTESPNIKTFNIGSNITKIGSNAFKNITSATININKPEGSVTGSPWGATSTTVNWAK